MGVWVWLRESCRGTGMGMAAGGLSRRLSRQACIHSVIRSPYDARGIGSQVVPRSVFRAGRPTGANQTSNGTRCWQVMARKPGCQVLLGTSTQVKWRAAKPFFVPQGGAKAIVLWVRPRQEARGSAARRLGRQVAGEHALQLALDGDQRLLSLTHQRRVALGRRSREHGAVGAGCLL
jgi:hypothetical protein